MTAAAAVTLGLFGGLMPAQAASAAPVPWYEVRPGLHHCDKGYFCLWEHAGYQGRGVAFYVSAPDFTGLPAGLQFIHDRASSAFNNGKSGPGIKSTVVISQHWYGQGDRHGMLVGDTVSYLDWYDQDFRDPFCNDDNHCWIGLNDAVSSVQWI